MEVHSFWGGVFSCRDWLLFCEAAQNTRRHAPGAVWPVRSLEAASGSGEPVHVSSQEHGGSRLWQDWPLGPESSPLRVLPCALQGVQHIWPLPFRCQWHPSPMAVTAKNVLGNHWSNTCLSPIQSETFVCSLLGRPWSPVFNPRGSMRLSKELNNSGGFLSTVVIINF